MWLRLSGEAVNDDLQFSYDYDNDVWLDAVDVMGEGDDAVPIIYDANGNQVEISNVRYHWTNGRQLSAMTYIDDDGAEQPLASYTYDDNGIRTSKTYGDTTTYYTNVDGAITSQYCLDEDGAVTDLMQFLYDGSNELLGFTYNGATYFYVKNLQGDVIAVIDSTGTEKAVYEYGAYGTLIYSGGDLADVNPMRYRGYYYDSDAGMYYLQSRYYAPEFAKFLNSDLPEYAQQQKADHYGTNLFAYCCNDPVNNSDPTGRNSSIIGISMGYITALSAALAGLVASINTAMISIETAISTIAVPVACIAAIGVSIATITYTVKSLKRLKAAANETKKAVKSKINKNGIKEGNLKNNTVYVIVRKKTTDVVYVGRTYRYRKRKEQHQTNYQKKYKGPRFPKDKYTMYPIATNLSLSESRALEQAIITAYGLDTLNNMINSISPKKWKYFKREFKQMDSLIDSYFDKE